VRSKIGFAIGIVGLMFLLTISYLGGILAGIATGIIVLLILIYILSPYVKIETINPASKGIPLFLRKRLEDYTLDEGATIVVKNIPFIGDVFGYVPIHVGLVEIDFNVLVYDKDHFDLTISGAFSIEADPNKLIEFYNRGGAHGLDEKGETAKEKEGIHGIVDLLTGIAQSALIKASGDLSYSEIVKNKADLENEALKKMTANKEADVNALTPDKPYSIPGAGTKLLSFVINRIEAGNDLKKILTKQGTEKAEKIFRKTDVEIKRMLAQEMLGMTDEEFKKYKEEYPERLEDIYLILTTSELSEKMLENGQEIKLGDDILKIRLARLLNEGIDISKIIRLFSNLKGGK
jgi:hypothetical protein